MINYGLRKTKRLLLQGPFARFCEKLVTTATQKHRFKVLFFGNDEVSKPTIEKLHLESLKENSIIQKCAVITTPLEKKKSTQGVFHKYINDKDIQKFELNNSDLKNSWNAVSEYIKENSFNIGIIASFGKLIPGRIIAGFKLGAFVMHPSLLPKYRGACPIQHTLLNKERKTGVSIVEASIGKFDAGALISQKEVTIESYHRFQELAVILSHLGGDTIIEFLHNYDSLNRDKKVQNESETTHAKLIKDNNYVYLDFVNMEAEDLLRLYNSFYGSQLEPYSKFRLKDKERLLFFENLFIVTKASDIYKKVLEPIDANSKPGSIYWDLKHDKFNIYFKSKTSWLVSTKIKMDCTEYMPGDQLIRKYLLNKRFKDNSKEINYCTLLKDKI